MGIVPILLLVLGVLAASSVIIKMRPEAKDLIDKIVPIQGWLGLVGFCLGIYYTLLVFTSWIGLMKAAFVTWAIVAASTITMAILGLLMGFALISKYMLSKNEAAMAKGEAIRSKLATLQIPLGFAGIGLGIAGFIL